MGQLDQLDQLNQLNQLNRLNQVTGFDLAPSLRVDRVRCSISSRSKRERNEASDSNGSKPLDGAAPLG